MPRPAFLLTAIWLSIACHIASAQPPQVPSATIAPAQRLRVAQDELARADGVADLIELATHGTTAERVLALRGLGRTSGTVSTAHVRSPSLEALVTALQDPAPEIMGAAAAALGVAVSLDALDLGIDDALSAALPRAQSSAPAVLEAIGCAGSEATQPLLVSALADPQLAEAAAIALGRHGRRTLALSDAARSALYTATTNADGDVRYAAVYALSRESKPAESADATAALSGRLGDALPEVRAQAVAALGKRKALDAARALGAKPEQLLLDRDWRAAVEAVHALAASDAGLDAIADAIVQRLGELERGGDASLAQVITEGEKALAKAASRPAAATSLSALARGAKAAKTLPALTRGWITCLAQAAIVRAMDAPDLTLVQTCGQGDLPDWLRLPLVAELISANVGSLDARRSALTSLLADSDARVRAAGLGAVAALWSEGDETDHRRAIDAVVAALAAPELVIVGTALDPAAPALYDAIGNGDASELDAAVLARAQAERDPEIGAGVLALVGSRGLTAGASYCRDALQGNPVLAKAGADCLVALGESTPELPAFGALPAPPVELESVIGKSLRWRLTTSRGEIVIKLRPDVAPWTVATIASLTRKGFYDGIAYHRVVPDFVVQGGDPTETGYGGPGFSTPVEPGTLADGPGFRRGGVGVADAGRDTGGSQWFIMHSRAAYLDTRYSWFGSIERGQHAADALLVGDRVIHAAIEECAP